MLTNITISLLMMCLNTSKLSSNKHRNLVISSLSLFLSDCICEWVWKCLHTYVYVYVSPMLFITFFSTNNLFFYLSWPENEKVSFSYIFLVKQFSWFEIICFFFEWLIVWNQCKGRNLQRLIDNLRRESTNKAQTISKEDEYEETNPKSKHKDRYKSQRYIK